MPAHPPVVHPEPVGVRQRGRGVRPVRDAVLLDLEDVGEVRVHEQRHRAGDGLAAQVVQLEHLAQAVSHGPPSQHEQGAVRLPLRRRAPADERRGERLWPGDGESLDGVAVDAQLPPGQEPGVADEQAFGRAGVQVPVRLADGERRALQDGRDAALVQG